MGPGFLRRHLILSLWMPLNVAYLKEMLKKLTVIIIYMLAAHNEKLKIKASGSPGNFSNAYYSVATIRNLVDMKRVLDE